MDNNKLKEALTSGKPVLFTSPDMREAEYRCVSAIIYRKHGSGIKVTAEITDKNGISVSICDPKKLRFKEDQDGGHLENAET